MTQSLDILKAAIHKIHPLSEDGWSAFSHIWQPFSIARKQVISSNNTIDPYFYFNLNGILRLVYNSENGNETTIEFIHQGTFTGYLNAECRRKPSPFMLQAMTHTKLLRCLYSDLEDLMQEHPEIEQLIYINLGRRMETLLKHLVVVKCCSSQEKCQKILSETPELIQLVPQKYIANYLGIHATNFSKYKKPKHLNGM